MATLGRTGLLVHRLSAEQRRIYFENGVPSAMASTEQSELLGRQLLLAGLVSEADLERVLESGYRSGCQLGESLVGARLLSEERLKQALCEQRIRRMTALCSARAGELFFVDGATSGERVLGLSQKPLGPLVE